MAKCTFRNVHAKNRLFVAAIDLGTTYSGWAYSTINEPNKVFANQVWSSDFGTLNSLKTPSCVLLTPEKEFAGFGYMAESKFANLAENQSQSGWYYFRRFKMALHDDCKLTRHTTVEDISGKKMSALLIFAYAIEYLKDDLMKNICNSVVDVKDTEISYVLTVPAIWNDMAKRFMREAALKAGIPDDQLTIALEPEAASIWCQGLHTEVHRDSGTADFGICADGTQYMIVDLGGGTADITVHEKRPKNTLLEIHKPTGGPWGGTEVDKGFIRLLEDIFGSSVWKKYEEMEVEDVLNFYEKFEIKKRNIRRSGKGYAIIQIPLSMTETLEKYITKEELEIKFNKKIEWKRDKIKFDSELLIKCFEEPVNQVIAHIQNILSEKTMKNVSKIMLVGGFAESPYVQEIFKDKFAHKQIIIPPECGLAVLKGAVMFGHNPSIVTARISRYTYGLNIALPFDHRNHSREKLVETGAGPVCKDLFWKAVNIEQEVKNGHEVSCIGKSSYDNQSEITLKVVKSKNQNPVYTTDEDCEVVGEVVIPISSALKAGERAFDIILIFGLTELKVKSHHKSTGSEETYDFYL